jgi:hypothetical protein
MLHNGIFHDAWNIGEKKVNCTMGEKVHEWNIGKETYTYNG